VKNIVELAIDAAEAAIMLGARGLCAVAGVGESTTRNVHVDNFYADARRHMMEQPQEPCDICCTPEATPDARPVPPPSYYREHFADWDATKSTTEASPEADAGQPLASVVPLDSEDIETAAHACRMYATTQRFDSATEYWFDLARRIEAQK
jgi:hypothetical protein